MIEYNIVDIDYTCGQLDVSLKLGELEKKILLTGFYRNRLQVGDKVRIYYDKRWQNDKVAELTPQMLEHIGVALAYAFNNCVVCSLSRKNIGRAKDFLGNFTPGDLGPFHKDVKKNLEYKGHKSTGLLAMDLLRLKTLECEYDSQEYKDTKANIQRISTELRAAIAKRRQNAK